MQTTAVTTPQWIELHAQAMTILKDINGHLVYDNNRGWGCRNGKRIHVLRLNPYGCSCDEKLQQQRSKDNITSVCAHSTAFALYNEMIAELLFDVRLIHPDNIRTWPQPGLYWPRTAADLYAAAMWLDQHIKEYTDVSQANNERWNDMAIVTGSIRAQ